MRCPLSSTKWPSGPVRSLRERAQAFWAKYGGPLGLAINVLLTAMKLPAADLQNTDSEQAGTDHIAPRVALDQLSRIARSMGYESIYVLVDRVDELESTTNNSHQSFRLISSLLLDLRTLETSGLGFKFFLWDKLAISYRSRWITSGPCQGVQPPLAFVRVAADAVSSPIGLLGRPDRFARLVHRPKCRCGRASVGGAPRRRVSTRHDSLVRTNSLGILEKRCAWATRDGAHTLKGSLALLSRKGRRAV